MIMDGTKDKMKSHKGPNQNLKNKNEGKIRESPTKINFRHR